MDEFRKHVWLELTVFNMQDVFFGHRLMIVGRRSSGYRLDLTYACIVNETCAVRVPFLALLSFPIVFTSKDMYATKRNYYAVLEWTCNLKSVLSFSTR